MWNQSHTWYFPPEDTQQRHTQNRQTCPRLTLWERCRDTPPFFPPECCFSAEDLTSHTLPSAQQPGSVYPHTPFTMPTCTPSFQPAAGSGARELILVPSPSQIRAVLLNRAFNTEWKKCYMQLVFWMQSKCSFFSPLKYLPNMNNNFVNHNRRLGSHLKRARRCKWHCCSSDSAG